MTFFPLSSASCCVCGAPDQPVRLTPHGRAHICERCIGDRRAEALRVLIAEVSWLPYGTPRYHELASLVQREKARQWAAEHAHESEALDPTSKHFDLAARSESLRLQRGAWPSRSYRDEVDAEVRQDSGDRRSFERDALDWGAR